MISWPTPKPVNISYITRIFNRKVNLMHITYGLDQYAIIEAPNQIIWCQLREGRYTVFSKHVSSII